MAVGIISGVALVGALGFFAAYRFLIAPRAESTIASTTPTPAAATPTPAPIIPAGTPLVDSTPVAAPDSTPAVLPSAAPEPAKPDLRRAAVVRRETVPDRRPSGSAESRPSPVESGRETPKLPAGALRERSEERPAPTTRAARTQIHLEVESSQPSTGAQISALYAQVQIDGRPYRDFTIRFAGANSFARWKKIDKIVLDDVPLSAREITVVVATDASLDQERMEG